MARRVLLIVNAAAAGGRAGQRTAVLLEGLRRQVAHLDTVRTDGPRQAIELARGAAGHYDVVAAAGGDGTVNEVLSGLLLADEPRAALGILPVGTGNDAANQAGIRTLESAVTTLASGAVWSPDVIEVTATERGHPSRHYALLFAAVGFASEVIKRTTAPVKRWFGPRLCYSVGFFRAWLGFRNPVCRVRADGLEFAGPMFHVCAGNAAWAGGGMMHLSPGARMDDGRLEICLIEGLNRGEVLRQFPRLLRGTHPGHPRVRYFPGQTLSVESDPPLEVQLDGSLVGETPALFQIRPGAVRLLVPPLTPAAAARAGP